MSEKDQAMAKQEEAVEHGVHDGFCMWDTRTTDYRITGRECPFQSEEGHDA